MSLHKRLAVVCAAIFVLALADIFSPISLRGFTSDAVLLALGYLSLAALVSLAISTTGRRLSTSLLAGFSVVTLFLAVFTLTGVPFRMGVGKIVPDDEHSINPRVNLRMIRNEAPGYAYHGVTYELLTHPLPGLEWCRNHHYIAESQCDSTKVRTSLIGNRVDIRCDHALLTSMQLP